MKDWRVGVGAIAACLMAVAVPEFLLFKPVALPVLAQTNSQPAEQLVQQGIEQFQQGKLETAIQSWQQARSLYQQGKDIAGESKTLELLGGAYLTLDRYREAYTTFEALVPMAQTLGDRSLEARALGNFGIACKSLGLYTQAIETNSKAAKLLRDLGDRQGYGQALSNLGNVYATLGNYEYAETLYKGSLKIAQQTGDRAGEGMTQSNLGQVYLSQGKREAAIAAYQASLEIAQTSNNLPGQASTLINLGSAYLTLGDRAKALATYQQAWKISQSLGSRRLETDSLGSLGLAYDNLGNYGKAVEHYQKSLAIARTLGDPDMLSRTLNNLSETLRKAGKFSEAEQYLREAVKLLDSLRLGLSDKYGVSLFDTQEHTYNLLQQVLVATNQSEASLEATEQGRARAFVALLARRIPGFKNGAKSTTNPTTSNNQQLTVQPIQIDQIKQIARQQNATLVEYAIVIDDDFRFYGKQRGRAAELLIWVVQPTGQVHLRKVDLKPLWQKNLELDQVVKSARCFSATAECVTLAKAVRGIKVTAKDAPEPPTTRSAPLNGSGLRKLHQLLIQPIADLLPTDPEARVVFIPQQSLFLVPFPALQAADGKYLIEQHTILTAPSIQVLELTRKVRSEQRGERSGNSGSLLLTPDSFLIVGNPTMPKVVIVPGEAAEALAPLPGAEREAIAIAQLLNTTAITGAQATKASIVQKMSSARLIHLATHGLLEYGSVSLEGLGVPGAIALAPSGRDDGLLTASELIDLQMNAELVVLSACDTGQGRISGDGVIGLSRSLISAGVPSVIVSLWAVPDAPTAQLMTTFYQTLKTNPDKAKALRQAMLTTMKDHPRPLDWAAFTLIGEAE